jgi:uncharacterized alpha-E superfamily protein
MLSRVADNLYWMSRYLERAEHNARLVDVALNLSLEGSHPSQIEARWARLLHALHVPAGERTARDTYRITHLLTFDAANPNSIVVCIAHGRENARQVRERISSEMWMQVNRQFLEVRYTSMERIWREQPHEFFRALKDGVHLFQGITDSTMVRDEGWQFIQLGRYIERAIGIANLLEEHLDAFPLARLARSVVQDEYVEWLGLLKSLTAFEAYCKVYNADLQPQQIVEFVTFNAVFPHSIRFCVERIEAALQAISDATGVHKNSRAHRLAGRLRSALNYDQVEDMVSRGAHSYLEDIKDQCLRIHDTIYETYITYSAETALA